MTVRIGEGVAPVPQVEMHDTPRVHLANGFSQLLDETRRHPGRKLRPEHLARPKFQGKSELVDPEQEARDGRVALELLVGPLLPSDQPRSESTHPGPTRREVLYDAIQAVAPNVQNIRVADTAAAEHVDPGTRERFPRQRHPAETRSPSSATHAISANNVPSSLFCQ